MALPPHTSILIAPPPVGDGKPPIQPSLSKDQGGSQFFTPQSEDEAASPCYSPREVEFYENEYISLPNPGWMAPRRETPMWYTLETDDPSSAVEEDEEDEDEEDEEDECGETEEEKVYEADIEPGDEESEESESESEIDERLESEESRVIEKPIEVPSKEAWSSEEEGTTLRLSRRYERCVERCIEARSELRKQPPTRERNFARCQRGA